MSHPRSLTGLVRRAWLLADYGRMTRPSNAIGAAALVVTGGHLASGGVQPSTWLAACAMWCIAAFGYVSNDVADIAEDRINKPYRPLPSGRIKPQQARRFAQGLAAGGILLALPLSLLATIAAVAVLYLLHVYNHRLKTTPGAGNLLIGVLGGSALLTGAVVQNGLPAVLQSEIMVPAGLLATAITAREILKTLEDAPGDRSARRTTLATTVGTRATLSIYATFVATALLLMPLPYVLYGYSVAYLLLMLLGVALPLILPLAAVLAGRTDLIGPAVRPYLRWLKLSYAAGILALLLAR